MATLTPTLTLEALDSTNDSIYITSTDTLTLGDQKVKITRTISPNDAEPGGVQIFDTNLGKSYIYCKNLHATLTIYLVAAADTAESAAWIELAAGEFTFFPWAGAVDLFANTGDNGAGIAASGLEVLIFEA